MSALTEERPVTTTSTDDDVTHLVCCDVNLAHCGEDVTTEAWHNSRSEDECCPLCVVLSEAATAAHRCCAIGGTTW